MKNFLFLLFIPAILFAGDVSGFVDFVFSDRERENSNFQIGYLELGVSKEFKNGFSFEGALDFTSNGVGFGQTILIKEFSKILNLKFGYMDMPFGIDYEVYASPDRKTVTSPITTEKIFGDGWSDCGLDFFGSIKSLSYDFYFVNGNGEINDNNNGKTFGGKLSLNFLKNFNFGVSYMNGPYDDNNCLNLSRSGISFDFDFSKIKFKGEYISSKEDISDGEYKQKGFYSQILKYFGDNFYSFLRYGKWSDDVDTEKRISFGAGYDFDEIIFKIEIRNSSLDKHGLFFQTVVNF